MFDPTNPQTDQQLRSFLIHRGLDLIDSDHAGLDIVELATGAVRLHIGTGPADSLAPVLARTEGDHEVPRVHGGGLPALATRIAVVAGLPISYAGHCHTTGSVFNVARLVAGDDHAVEVQAVGADGAVLQLGPWANDSHGLAIRWLVVLPHEDGIDVDGVLEIPATGSMRPGTHRRALHSAALDAGWAACSALERECPDPKWRITNLTHVPHLSVDPDTWLAALTEGSTDC